jgi:hypothetical protein
MNYVLMNYGYVDREAAHQAPILLDQKTRQALGRIRLKKGIVLHILTGLDPSIQFASKCYPDTASFLVY